MNEKQLKLYHDNLLAFSYSIDLVGGYAYGVLENHRGLLETLARNGLKVTLSHHVVS